MLRKIGWILIGLLFPVILFGLNFTDKKGLKILMKKRQAVLLFVGSKKDWKSNYIKGSKQIYPGMIQKQAYRVLPGRAFTVVLYAPSVKQALGAAKILESKHYKKIFVLKLRNAKITQASSQPVQKKFVQSSRRSQKDDKQVSLNNTEKVKATIFRDAKGRFDLQPTYKVIRNKIHFKGKTDYAVIWFQVSKASSGAVHNMKYFPNSYRRTTGSSFGSFDLDYFFKDGTGNYKVYILGADRISAKRFKGLMKFTVLVDQVSPKKVSANTLNQQVVAFVEKHKGEKIGRGECWDVAQQALDENGADWSRPVNFGRLLNPHKDQILPGDIIQFRSVKTREVITNKRNGRTSYLTRTSTIGAPDHTAVVYRVLGKNLYEVMHQNVSGKRYIVKGKINLNGMKQGKVWFYRPIKGLILR